MWVSGEKVFETCARCGLPVPVRPILRTLHACLTDCEAAGVHLGARMVRRGLRRRRWLVCDTCGERMRL